MENKMKLILRIVCLVFLVSGTLTQDGFSLEDALDNGKPPPKATVPPPPKKKDDFELDLSDAFEDADPVNPKPPVVMPPKSGGGGGGGGFGDGDLLDVSEGNYEPDGGKSKGRALDPEQNAGGAGPPQEAGPGQIAGIASAIGVALLGAASSYFAYQKKKLCFKIQGGQDPESGNRQVTQSEPQVMSTLLQSS